MGERLGTAGVQYGDFRGTVSIDEPDDEKALYELAGISPDEWHIVALEMHGSYDLTGAYVWAVPRGEASYDHWQSLAREGKETVPANRFKIDPEKDDAALTLLPLNKRWSIHALYRSLADLGLDVESVD